jgi:hypothetical protein
LVGVKWISQGDFKTIAFNRNNQCMWKRVQNILRFNTAWTNLWLVLTIEVSNIVKSWSPHMKRSFIDQFRRSIRV